MSKKVLMLGRNILVTLGVPALVYGLMWLLCFAFGASGYGVGNDWRNILLNTTYTGLIALAVSYNLTSGRFDFSVGSVLILSTIIAGTIASQNGLGPMAMLVISVSLGAVLGAVSGLFYVLLRLPPMIVSLGVAMIYEALGFMLNKSGGIRLLGRSDLLIFAKSPNNLILVGVILIILVYLLNFTKFGYNTSSLRSGQKNAVDVGINENRNAVACYALAGVLMGAAGMIYLSQYGQIAPSTGLASSAYIMSAFLPMFIGDAMKKYSDRNIGVIMGAFIQACITSGFSKLGLNHSVQQVLNGTIVLVFLVYTANQYKIFQFRQFGEKRQRAIREEAESSPRA